MVSPWPQQRLSAPAFVQTISGCNGGAGRIDSYRGVLWSVMAEETNAWILVTEPLEFISDHRLLSARRPSEVGECLTSPHGLARPHDDAEFVGHAHRCGERGGRSSGSKASGGMGDCWICAACEGVHYLIRLGDQALLRLRRRAGACVLSLSGAKPNTSP
jgi:hypothetical protein